METVAKLRGVVDFGTRSEFPFSAHDLPSLIFATRVVPLCKEGAGTISVGGSMTDYAQQRKVPRFNFIASVDISDPTSGVRLAGRISEISRKGCFIDVLNTLPKDSSIQLRVTRDRGTFVTVGRVIYTQETVGMGIAFVDTAADQMEILDSWLAELAA
jgi:hypothetical protein